MLEVAVTQKANLKDFEEYLRERADKIRKEEEQEKEHEQWLKNEEINRLTAHALHLNYQIRQQQRKGIRSSRRLDLLFSKSEEVEIAIWKRLLSGEKITLQRRFEGKKTDSELIDYCFAHFYRGSYIIGLESTRYSTSAADLIPNLRRFISQAESLLGQRVLVVERLGDDVNNRHINFTRYFANEGVISGAPKFEMQKLGEYLHRNLVIPITSSKILNEKEKWKTGEDYLRINEHIFLKEKGISNESPQVISVNNGHIWNVLTGPYYGGAAFSEWSIYLGNNVTKKRFKEGF